MTKPMLLADFVRLPPAVTVAVRDGLSGAIDTVAERAPVGHRFLRYGWFEAALKAYGGAARTLVVQRDGVAMAAVPMVNVGPAVARMAAVPGCYWPFRSFPVREDAGVEVGEALLTQLAREVNILRIGPIYDNDPALGLLLPAARASGWAVLDRFIAESYLLDMDAQRADGTWPRNSTLKKNRFHEKHLAAHGELDWSFVSGADWDEAAFDALAAVEERSWIAARTDGGDAKFTRTGHGAFWRAAAADPVIARMMWAALLRVDDVPSAFSFDLNAGAIKYAIANSYDPAYGKHSPGKLLYYRNLVRALEDGITQVDWGAGDSGYKRVIGASEGPAIRDWLFVRPGVAAGAAKLLQALWRRSGNAPKRERGDDGRDHQPEAGAQDEGA